MQNIAYSKTALKYLIRLQPKQRQRIIDKIKAVATGETADVRALTGRPGHYRLRVGDIRVIWKWSDDQITLDVIAVGPRGDIYND